MKELLQDITIYHKNNQSWDRYNLSKVSVRNTSIRNRDTTGVTDVNNATIRIFDIDGYNNIYFVNKDDVIVTLKVDDEIKLAPLTELKSKYGKDNVYQVSSIDKFIFKDSDLKDLQHIKLGAI
ncbi:MAG: DUF6751 family protein [Bacilli bacterium]